MAVRVIVLLGLALVIGVGTIIFAKKWIDTAKTPPQTTTIVEEVVPDSFVLVAQGNLQPGTRLGPEMVRWQGWPTEDVPPSYVVQGQRSEDEFFGAVVRYPMAAGEPITQFKVARPGQQGYLAAVLEPGMRAVTVPTSEIRASAGFILPGDRVDVVLTHDTGVGTVSETVFFDMRVLAIDQALGNPEGGARVGRNATLEVTPREVEAFTLMQQMGTLSLSLRSLEPEDLQDDQGPNGGQTELLADAAANEKPEVVDKIPAVYPGGVPDEAGEQSPVASVDSAVGEALGEMTETTEDEHSIRRQGQTFTSSRDVSVLIGGGGGAGSVVVIRGN